MKSFVFIVLIALTAGCANRNVAVANTIVTERICLTNKDGKVAAVLSVTSDNKLCITVTSTDGKHYTIGFVFVQNEPLLVLLGGEYPRQVLAIPMNNEWDELIRELKRLADYYKDQDPGEEI